MFLVSLMNSFMAGVDQVYQTQLQDLSHERNELQVNFATMEGKYEGVRQILEAQKDMSEKLMSEARKNYGDQLRQYENQIEHIQLDYNKRLSTARDSMRAPAQPQVLNRGAINMLDIKRSNDNFRELMDEYKTELLDKYKEKLVILAEKQEMEKEREMEKEVYKLMRQSDKEVMKIKESYMKEISALKEEINRLQLLRKENLSIIIQKEAEIKLLQEKIRADSKQKHTQIQHAKDLCKVKFFLLDF